MELTSKTWNRAGFFRVLRRRSRLTSNSLSISSFRPLLFPDVFEFVVEHSAEEDTGPWYFVHGVHACAGKLTTLTTVGWSTAARPRQARSRS